MHREAGEGGSEGNGRDHQSGESGKKKGGGGFSKFCFLVVVFTDFLMILVFLLIFLGKGSNLTNYTNNFSNGWFNHQLVLVGSDGHLICLLGWALLRKRKR